MDNKDALEISRQAKDLRREQLGTAIAVGIMVLSSRFLTVFALALQAAIFGWAMIQGGWDRLAVAVAFAVGSWCLVNLKVSKGEGS